MLTVIAQLVIVRGSSVFVQRDSSVNSVSYFSNVPLLPSQYDGPE